MTIIIFIIVLFILLFFVLNSIIWLKHKKIKNINDKIIEYTIYINFIIIISILLLITYLYYYDLKIIIINKSNG